LILFHPSLSLGSLCYNPIINNPDESEFVLLQFKDVAQDSSVPTVTLHPLQFLHRLLDSVQGFLFWLLYSDLNPD